MKNYADSTGRLSAGIWMTRDVVWACEYWKKRALEESEW